MKQGHKANINTSTVSRHKKTKLYSVIRTDSQNCINRLSAVTSYSLCCLFMVSWSQGGSLRCFTPSIARYLYSTCHHRQQLLYSTSDTQPKTQIQNPRALHRAIFKWVILSHRHRQWQRRCFVFSGGVKDFESNRCGTFSCWVVSCS